MILDLGLLLLVVGLAGGIQVSRYEDTVPDWADAACAALRLIGGFLIALETMEFLTELAHRLTRG